MSVSGSYRQFAQIVGCLLVSEPPLVAYSTAYVFGGTLPIFYEVDQVSFSMPVNVGDLINVHSRVLYCTSVKEALPDFDVFEGQRNIPLVSVQVEAWIIDPVQASAQLSNQFFFTFALPAGTDIRKVLPGNMEEARVMATRMEADQVQDQDR